MCCLKKTKYWQFLVEQVKDTFLDQKSPMVKKLQGGVTHTHTNIANKRLNRASGRFSEKVFVYMGCIFVRDKMMDS